MTGYGHITTGTRICDVMDHPAFGGRGRLLFPWDDRDRNTPDRSMGHAPDLLLWHTCMDPEEMVAGVNRLIDDVNMGRQVIYDIYTDAEKEQDPRKEDTCLFFLRGEPGAPFCVFCPGGGFYYVGSLHTGFPIAMEFNRHGYNAFVLNYRVGEWTDGEWMADEDLQRAVSFILDHAEELQVSPHDYAVGGESAGARMASDVCYGECAVDRSDGLLHPALAIILYTFFAGKPEFEPTDPPAYLVIGGRDPIVRQRYVTERYEEMRAAGIPAVCRVFPTAPHGFGLGRGCEAEGWFEDMIRYWESLMAPRDV